MNSNISLYFLGWDISTTAASSGAGIHHPRRSPKKISLTNSVVNRSSSFTTTDGITYPANNFWRAEFYSGTTEPGSSGSPLLNQNNRVVGQALSSTIACPPNAFTTYGRFDKSWDQGSSSSTRLRDHLDPSNSTSSLNGKDCNLTINNKSYSAGTHVLAGCDVTISNTVISSNGVVRIHGQNSLVLNPGFEVQFGSSATLTAGSGIFTQ